MSWTPSTRQLERQATARRMKQRSATVSVVATVLVLGGLVVAITASPGWPLFHKTFLSWPDAKDSFPDIAKGFWLNVRIFLVAEPLILVLGAAVAIVRTTTAASLLPIRILAVIYTDLFRGLPTILVVLLLGFGMPALQLQGMPTSLLFWSTVSLVLSYGAYVAEVFRSGIESIHPSQLASADALGLSHSQSMRFVILPQAVRRVVPPLLNDFVSLQKDTALVSSVGILDAVFAAKDYGSFNFNYTPLVVVAGFFVVCTVPLARLTDWLQARWLERERAGAL